jgi:lysosomal alpha-mannosidase
MKDGSLEFMVHRRLLYNDGTVDGEPLNEPGRDGRGLIVRGRFLVLVEASKSSARLHRLVGEEEFLRPLLAFSLDYNQQVRKSMRRRVEQRYQNMRGNRNKRNYGGFQAVFGYHALTRPLPANVHLLTLEKHDKILLLRLEHQFAVGEDEELSKSASVKLKGLFNDFTILSVTELNLSANLVKEELVGDFDVTLNAMEIRTFKIDVEWKQSQRY